MRYHPHTTYERLHDENQPRNVVLFAGDVGLNTYFKLKLFYRVSIYTVRLETVR